jgi:hypothetical protein
LTEILVIVWTMSVDTCLGFVSVSYFIEDQMLQYLFLFGIIYLWGNISHFHSMNLVWAQCRIAEFMHFQCWESLENHIDQSAWNRVLLTDTPFFCCHVWQYALWKLYHESPCLLGVLYTSPTCRPCRTPKLILNKVNPLFFLPQLWWCVYTCYMLVHLSLEGRAEGCLYWFELSSTGPLLSSHTKYKISM